MTVDREQPYPPWYFRREDESPDRFFYIEPRLVVHIDDHAIAAIAEYFVRTLPKDAVILDLLSSWRSHLPEDFLTGKLVGLGLNTVEMRENPQLDERVVHDVNADPRLPFDNEVFDAAIITVSIQYLTQPVKVFQEVRRVLKEGASFHVVYSNRMFPTKAVAIWQRLDDAMRGELVASYFAKANGWDRPEKIDISPQRTFYTDPVHVVAAEKKMLPLL